MTKKKVLIILSVIAVCIIVIAALTTKTDKIESLALDNYIDEELGLTWSELVPIRYEGEIIVTPSNININDIELVVSNSSIITAKIKSKNDNKIKYEVISKAIGETYIFAQTKDGLIKTENKKIIVMATDEKLSIIKLRDIGLSNALAININNQLKQCGIPKIDSSAIIQNESEGTNTIIIAVFNGLTVDIEVKNNILEKIFINSNLGNPEIEEELVLYNRVNDNYTKVLTTEEFNTYKSSQLEAENILIRAYVASVVELVSIVRTAPNSVGGVDVKVNFKNTSDKAIKYIKMSFFAKNAVGDEVFCEIRGQGIRIVTYTGPLNVEAETGIKTAEVYFYNNTITAIGFNYLEIEYMDDTEIIFDVSMLNALMYNYNH